MLKKLEADMPLKKFIWFRNEMSGLILMNFLCLVKMQTPAKKIVVMLSDEVNNTSNVSFHLPRPKDVIAGACLASHEFCKFQDCVCHFQVHPLLVPPSDPVKGVPKLLEILLDPAVEVIGVTGVVSDIMEEYYSPLITHFDEKIPQKYTNSYLPSLGDTANTVIEILQQLNWTKVTIIQSNTYKYGKVANHIRTANTTFDFIAINEYTIMPTVQKLKYGGTKIFVILAPPHISFSVVQKAIEEGVVWPHYVWVVVLLEPASLTLSATWENVFLIMYKSPTLDYSNTTCTENVSSTSNFYSSLLCDAVWQVLMGNKSLYNSSKELSTKFSDMNHEHRNRSVCFRQNTKKLKETRLLLGLYIVWNKTLLELRNYGVTDSYTELVNVVDLPTDQLPSRGVKFSWLLLASLCIITFIAYVLAFVNLFLMVSLRNEKEVKASSFNLTLVIYIGSCLLILSTTVEVLSLILTINNITLSSLFCIPKVCSFRTGLAVLLLTCIVKTLRIWRIFRHFGKMTAAWSDSRLLVVVLIGSSAMLLLSIVSAYDIKHDVIKSFRNDTAPPYYEYTSTCFLNLNLSQNFAFTLVNFIQFAYYIILYFLLLILAFKTRNIKRSNFKETKRTTIFITAYFLVSILVSSLAFKDSKTFIALSNVYFVVTSFFSQIIIFPTFFPIFYRFVLKHYY